MITDNTRVYLVGHGAEDSSSLGGCTAKDLAATIKTFVPSGKRIKRLSLLGCHTGKGQMPEDGPPRRLVKELWELVKAQVLEITGLYRPGASQSARVGRQT
jgi:hypothetical protein